MNPSETSARPLLPLSVHDHIKRYPNCRPSTLVRLMERDKVNARLLAEVEARVDGKVAAAFKTFALNTKRAYLAGRL